MLPEKWKRKRIISLVLLIFSAFYSTNSLRLKWGNMKNPGPGLFPIAIGFFLLLCTGLYFFKLLRSSKEEAIESHNFPSEIVKTTNYFKVYGTLACTLVYPFILELLKFISATTLVTFFLLFVLKPQKILFTFFLAFFMSVFSFWVFAILLGVSLPFGLLEEFLFQWLG